MSDVNRRGHRAPPAARTPRPREDLGSLVHGTKAGDERVWELLIGRFDATIRGVARRHGINDSDRDAVAQQTWIQLLLNIDQAGQHAALGGWLHTTARRECLRVLAAGRREVPVEEPVVADASDATSAEDHAALDQRRVAVWRALEAVPHHQLRVMSRMLDEPSVSYDDVSAALRMPRGSIRPTRGRRIARLRVNSHLAGAVGASGSAIRRQPPGHDLT